MQNPHKFVSQEKPGEQVGMSAEAQRITIAEACGWKSNGAGYWRKDGRVVALNPYDLDDCGGIGGTHRDGLPDYLNDLNAMAEAEKVLGKNYSSESCNYEDWLVAILGCDQVWRATAAQRAKAFLKTIGKWTNDEQATLASSTSQL